MSGGSSRRYPPELRERAVRMVAEISDQHESEWAAISEVARLLGVGCAETVRKWVRQVQVDAGARPGTTTEESAELKRLRRENAELRRASDFEDIVGFLRGRARPATALITRFIADHQGHHDGPDGLRWGVESICRQLTELGVPIAPSTYYDQVMPVRCLRDVHPLVLEWRPVAGRDRNGVVRVPTSSAATSVLPGRVTTAANTVDTRRCD